jgi:hypothetical protein
VGSQFLDRFAVTHENDHASQCTFTFSDGRRCRTPRTANHSHFCFDHAQKEARATETLGKELALLLLRRLPLRLRSQRRPRSRRYKTQNRPHRRLPGANAPPVHPSRPARIHQRLQRPRLTQRHLQFRQRQPRPPLPTRACPSTPRRREIPRLRRPTISRERDGKKKRRPASLGMTVVGFAVPCRS